MLTELEVERLFVELDLPEEGRKLVRFARTESPVRKVISIVGNSIISQFSRKMGGKHHELESRTLESPAATLYEDDSYCLEYWPQPCKVDLFLKDDYDKNMSRIQHAPDFLEIQKNGFFVHEWREESRLLGLSKESSQFKKDENGQWHYKAAEELFEKIGLKYKLHSSFELPRTFIENVWFLEDYQLAGCPPIPEDIENNLVKLLAEHGSMPFLQLIHDHGYSSDNVFKALLKRSIFVDLHNTRLDVSMDLFIHRDPVIAKVHFLINSDQTPPLPIPGMARLSSGAKLKYDSKEFEVILVGGGNVLLKDDMGNKFTLPLDDVVALHASSDIDISNTQIPHGTPAITLADFSHEQIETGIKRINILTNNYESPDIVSDRTIQRWKSNITESMPMIDKLIALVDRNCDKGNRLRRLPDIVESIAEDTIRNYFNKPEWRTAIATYYKYQEICEEHGVEPMSYPTFTKRVKARTSIKDREGTRKAYQENPIPLSLDYMFPIHGVRPHEVCYIDHTPLNLASAGPEGSELGKPFFSYAGDGNTTQARAFFLGYDPPSAKVVLMVLRDYVRRHNRLPKILVVDGAKEFWSKELKLFCHFFGIDLRHRPEGMPRGGSPVERAIGATEAEVIAQMQGNTRIMKNVRMVTKAVNPFHKAIWTLTAIHGAFEDYLFNIRDNRIHPTLGSTPHDYEAMRKIETGQREHVLVKFDENIMLLTCPHTKRRYHKIDRQRGVWADNRYYWHDSFKTANKSELVEVRVEPWVANIVYVYFRNRWIVAITRDLRPYEGRTRREVELAIRSERRKAKINANKDRLRRDNSKKMLELWVPEKFDDRIGMQQREMKYLYSRLGMGVALADSIPIHEQQVNITTPLTPQDTCPKKSDSVESIDDSKQTRLDRSENKIWEGINGFH